MSFSFPNIFLGLLSAGLGLWLVKDAYHINHHILFLGWVERKYGPGMGTTAYKLLGIGFILFGFFVGFGFIDLFGAAFPVTESTETPAQFRSGGRGSGQIVD